MTQRKPFRMVPDSFIDACAAGEITKRQFFLGCFLLRVASYKTGELSMTLTELTVHSGYERSPRSLVRDLKALSPWVEFDLRQGQRTPCKFRITGLSTAADDPSLRHDFGNELPDSAEVESPLAEVPAEIPAEVPGQAEAAQGEGLGAAGGPVPAEVPAEVPVEVPLSTTSTTSTEGSEVEQSGEGSYDHGVGKTTAAHPDAPAPLTDLQPCEFPAGFTADEWRRLQPEERELFTYLQRRCVHRDGGRWLEDDDGSERP